MGNLDGISSIHAFDVGVTLGTGSFGRVRFATHIESQDHYAIKMLKKSEIVRFQQIEHLKSEKTILEEISFDPHPFIVNLASSFQDKRYMYMVLEYVVGGEFFTHLRNAGCFDNTASQFYSAHIVLIFENLHSQDIIYRDLKPEVRTFILMCVQELYHARTFQLMCFDIYRISSLTKMGILR
mmetsp:Transcript_12951/g.19390  ORF Transcript_12951/g.19390 Transcript_12951/m.19390 type:complete len:182 (-) Transcript_12951:696-1241(-)